MYLCSVAQAGLAGMGRHNQLNNMLSRSPASESNGAKTKILIVPPHLQGPDDIILICSSISKMNQEERNSDCIKLWVLGPETAQLDVIRGGC